MNYYFYDSHNIDSCKSICTFTRVQNTPLLQSKHQAVSVSSYLELVLPFVGVRACSPAHRELLQRPGGRCHGALQELQPEEQRQRPRIRWGPTENFHLSLGGVFFFLFLLLLLFQTKQKRLETRGTIEAVQIAGSWAGCLLKALVHRQSLSVLHLKEMSPRGGLRRTSATLCHSIGVSSNCTDCRGGHRCRLE